MNVRIRVKERNVRWRIWETMRRKQKKRVEGVQALSIAQRRKETGLRLRVAQVDGWKGMGEIDGGFDEA